MSVNATIITKTITVPFLTEPITVTVQNGLPFGPINDITGPASSTAGNFASFLSTTGKVLVDSGYNAASFLKQGANVLTQDLNFDGAFNVGFGQSVPLNEFEIQVTQYSHNGVGDLSNLSSYVDIYPNEVILNATSQTIVAGITANVAILNQDFVGLQSSFDLLYLGYDGTTPGRGFNVYTGTSSSIRRLQITEAGVFKFLPAVAPVVGYVPTATNVDGTWTWQAGGGGITFPLTSSQLQINNPAATFKYTITSGAIAANRVLNLPVITVDSTLATVEYVDSLTLPAFDATHDGYVANAGVAYKLLYSDGAWFAGGASGTILKSAGATSKPVFSTETYAVPGSSGNVMTSDGTNWTSAAPAGLTNPMTNIGDLIQGTTAGAPVRLADVAVGSWLRSGGVNTAVAWSTPTLPNSSSVGDILYASATNVYSNLAAVAIGKYLRSAGVTTAPVWSTTTMPNTATTGDLWQGVATNSMSSLASVAAGSFLRSGGVATVSAWSTTVWTNSATTGDVLSASATNVYANIAAVAVGQVFISQGAATLPAWSNTLQLTGAVAGNFFGLTTTNTSNNSAAFNFGIQMLNDTGGTGARMFVNSSTNTTNYGGAGSMNFINFYNGNLTFGGNNNAILGITPGNGGLLIANGVFSSIAITASTRLDIRGQGTTTNIALRIADSANTLRFTMLDNGSVGFFGVAAVAQQSVNTILVNNVTSGGTLSTIANFTDLTTYANDSAAIRNNFFRLTEKVLKLETALRNYGLAKD